MELPSPVPSSMVPSSDAMSDLPVCCKCNHPCQELQFLDCGCYIHATCFPISSIFQNPINETEASPSIICPGCGTTVTKGIYLHSMKASTISEHFPSFPNKLDIGNEAYRSGGESDKNSSKGDDDNGAEFYASIAPLFRINYSKTDQHNSSVTNEVQFRNGRWSKEEFEYVECVINFFNAGCLPILCGTTLNDVLRSLLLCKSTRLRKKIKNANFCTRTYHVNTNDVLLSVGQQNARGLSPLAKNDVSEIFKLQEIFLESIDSDDERTLLRFNMTRTWTTLFWKFILDIRSDSQLLLVEDWLNDVEELERMATSALDQKKQSERRKRVDRGLHSSTGDTDNFPSLKREPLPIQEINLPAIQFKPDHPGSNIGITASSMYRDFTKEDDYSEKQNDDEFEHLLDVSSENNTKSKRARVESEYFCDSDKAGDIADVCHELADWKPFVDKVTSFMQNEKLPFEYFDIWIAEEGQEKVDEDNEEISTKPSISTSIVPSKKINIPKLRHVGHGIRSDTDSIFTIYHMNEFGKYSADFIFPPGIGLPGRVYDSGQPLWDDCIQDLTLNEFPRVSGANAHGVKKALGIPLSSCSVGRVVIGLYCSEEIEKSDSIVQQCCMEFQTYNPTPKWQLCVDIGQSNDMEDDRDLLRLTSGAKEVDATEEKIVDLLGKFAALTFNEPNEAAQTVKNVASLRLRLLKSPSLRTEEETAAIETLKRSYVFYSKSERSDNDLAMLLANDWMLLSSELPKSQQQPVLHPIAINMHHINYGAASP